MIRLIVVDPDLEYGEALKQAILNKKPTWAFELCPSVADALDLLDENRFDIVCTEIFRPEMYGMQLLAQIREGFPYMARFVCSRDFEPAIMLRSLGFAHQIIPKPCQIDDFIDYVVRAYSLRALLGDSRLNNLLGKVNSIPSVPQTYFKLVQLVNRDDYSQKDLVNLLSQDPSILLQILRTANSAYFGARRQITNINDAIVILGLKIIKAIVLGAESFLAIDQKKAQEFKIEALLEHGFQVGSLASTIALRSKKTRDLSDDALTAGVLHDIGKLVLIDNIPEEYRKVQELVEEAGLPSYEAEEEVFGISHQEVGAYVLGLWGLPDSIVEAVAYHHQPLACANKSRSPLSFVSAANAIVHQYQGLPRGDFEELLQHLTDIDADEEFNEWVEMFDKLRTPDA